MKISVFGIGYVGAVASACLARDGHDVVAVDVSPFKVDTINAGRAPLVEPGLEELVAAGVKSGKLRGILDAEAAIAETELSFVCVGTPSRANGNIDLNYIVSVCEQIGRAIGAKAARHTVVMRSTMLPGTMNGTVIPLLEKHSGKKAFADFGVAIFPEFLREGTAIKDYGTPGSVVLGAQDDRSRDQLLELNAIHDCPKHVLDLATAEMIKYTNNVWHAAKISFANEIGAISKAIGVDGRRVMEVLCSDTRLNVSPAYMMPGFAFGGSCLPKDLRALKFLAKSHDVPTPMLDATVAVNENQIQMAMRLIMSKGSRKLGLLGLTFKANTDDLRESPLVELAERLLGKGYDIRIYDRNVNPADLIGANRNFVHGKLPHLSELLVDEVEDVVNHADTLVIGTMEREHRSISKALRQNQSVIDLVRLDPALLGRPNYDGICW